MSERASEVMREPGAQGEGARPTVLLRAKGRVSGKEALEVQRPQSFDYYNHVSYLV